MDAFRKYASEKTHVTQPDQHAPGSMHTFQSVDSDLWPSSWIRSAVNQATMPKSEAEPSLNLEVRLANQRLRKSRGSDTKEPLTSNWTPVGPQIDVSFNYVSRIYWEHHPKT